MLDGLWISNYNIQISSSRPSCDLCHTGISILGGLGLICIDEKTGIDLDQILFSTAKSVFQAVFQWFYRRIAAGVVINNGKCKPCGKRLAVNAAADHPQHRDKKYDRDHMKFIIF